MPTDEKLKMRGNRGPTRPNPSQLAAGLTQNAQMANQMGNIYAGSRMTSGPTGRMFIPGQMPQSQSMMDPKALKRAQRAAEQAADAPRLAAFRAGNPDPWGEGKPWATKEQWDLERRQANPYQFDWSRDDNSPEAVANQMFIENMAKNAVGRTGGNYQTPDVIANALSKYTLDPAYANWGTWGAEDYAKNGYTLQDPTDVQKKFGMTEQQWVKTNPAQSQSLAQPQQPVMQQEGAPTQIAANNAAQQPNPVTQNVSPVMPGLGGGGMQSGNTNFTGKGNQSLPQYGKGNQQLPRP